MQFNNDIPTTKESQWTAFLNGEPDLLNSSHPDMAEITEFTEVWEATGTQFSHSAANPDLAWSKLQPAIMKPDRQIIFTPLRSRMLKFAAMVILAVGLGLAAYQLLQSPVNQLSAPVMIAIAETEAHPASLRTITLPDGTTVKMNASTRIEYPEQFTSGLRKIKLSGEAFFEVTRDTARPFIIETTHATVEVLGTSFNISAYPAAGTVEVNVETGKVKLTPFSGGAPITRSVLLPAGERGWLNIADNEIGHAENLSMNYSAWITKKINFQRTPLAEAFAVLENTYHVKIKTENPEIAKIPYTANFANLELDYITEVISRTHNLKVKRTGDEIIFSRAGN